MWMVMRNAALRLTMAAVTITAFPTIAEARPKGLPPVSALVVNAATGATLYRDAPERVRAPASLTKMMTMFLTFEALARGDVKPNTSIRISRHAANQPPSRLGIAPGKTLSVRNALRIMAVDSANDVTVAMAEALGGSENRFVSRMNATAGRLGLRNTHFANATGLKNPGNRTTARDMATLSLALIHRYPEYYDVFGTRKVSWNTRTMRNHNHLLGKVTGVDGIKTGYTIDAGYNLAASAKRKGVRIVVIVLGARTAADRDLRVANLLELGFIPPVVRRPKSRDETVTPSKRVKAAKTRARP
ncbi:hypothetical protein ASG11_12515 [Sphingomonas sp. Leaf357]|uniref:D-alanyl-D-alanine carboxypeptidase family protein n=1 Tax=Sphingomonas sp. Leaf357 TaxID=1736350 RepID=UPI00070073E0|nr:D-alanyl-D-alanine carboxypeptidase family protein [Sphingomonas sp. Leaf357]KQS04970.1 hypothetical protein ASG11_12515 [Sphingomonas sp. Leaf357]